MKNTIKIFIIFVLMVLSSLWYLQANDIPFLEATIECKADCFFGSCSATCDQGTITNGGGGALCTCYGGFPSCACGEGHNADFFIQVTTQQIERMNRFQTISSSYTSDAGIYFHQLLLEIIDEGPVRKSNDKELLNRFETIQEQIKVITTNERRTLLQFIEHTVD